MKSDPVVISGGGPVGLVAALALARSGIEVVVLEAADSIPRDLRAGTFHPPTVEMLANLGVGDKLLASGIQVPEWQIRDRRAGVIASFDLGLIADETPYPYRLHCEQHKLSHLLHEALQQSSHATIRLGERCTGFSQDKDGVSVNIERTDGSVDVLRGSYLIGADGARSTVRKSLGVEFEGFTWPERFLVFATRHDLREDGFSGNAYIADPDEWCAIFVQPHDGPPGIWRIAFPVPGDMAESDVLSDSFVQSRIQGFLSPDREYDIPYRSIYRVHQRVASTFRVGRIVLAGDAAHVNNPLGGMGLNSGIHDAVNLAEKLGAVIDGAAPDLLDRYVRQRRQTNIEYVQAITIRNKRLLEERDPKVRANRFDELRQIAADPSMAREHLLSSSMINSVRRAAHIV
ncbi:FAD-dependent oxidoreductase [Variovorax sp. UC122_21]|uniref:FAD-dependent oxidoreductase n=1 Tax=Variovorax sp. UC122_21 TaxID=3374554 RepID=UPI00375681B9